MSRQRTGFPISADKIKNILFTPSAHRPNPRPPTILCGRADNACTNLLGFLVRCVRMRGMVEIAESAKLSAFALPFAARTCHAWLARLTRARRTRFGRRTARVLLADFWYFSSLKSTIKEKLLYVFLCQYRRESTKNHHNADSQKRGFDSPFFCLFT